MSAFPGPGNPFVYAQFRLQGGWKGMLTIGGIYAAVIGGLVVINLSADSGGTAAAAWPPILITLQLVALYLVGLLRVNAAVRADVTSRMIESHRLMPVPPFAAVVGYVFGGALLGLLLAAINLVLGLACCSAAGTDEARFMLANVTLGVSAALTWVVAAHLAFTSRFGLFLLMFVSTFSFALGNDLARVLPGLGLLTAGVGNPLKAVFPRSTGNQTDTFAVALVAQGLIAAISCRAAVRLYRSAGAIGMTAALGLALLGVWAGLSVVALGFPDFVYPSRTLGVPGADVPTQVVATLIVGMLVATVAVAGACRAARGRAVPPVLVPLLAAVLVTAIPLFARVVNPSNVRTVVPFAAMPDPPADDPTGPDPFATTRPAPNASPGRAYRGRPPWFMAAAKPVDLTAAQNRTVAAVAGSTFVVVAAFLAAVTTLLHWAYRRRMAGWPLAFIWIVFTWIVPLIAEAVRQAMAIGYDRVPGTLFSISPIGALTTLWSRPSADRPVGPVLAQVVLVGLPVMFAISTSRKRPRPTPAAMTVA